MPIGEFGRPPASDVSPALTTPMYWMYEMGQASLNPARAFADMTKLWFENPLNLLSNTDVGKSIAAGCELFERTTRRYGKPEWGLYDTEVNGVRVPVEIKTVWEKPFCRLLYFDRGLTQPLRTRQPRVLIVAPMSGHYATLLRGTVEAFLPGHEVYITDWADARMVPLAEGRFDLDDYVDYVIEMLHALGGNTHVVAVCQPSVPVLAAVSVMEAEKDPYFPTSMTLMGRPDRHAAQPHRRQRTRREEGHQLVPQPRHHQGAVPASRLHAQRLSRLPAAHGVHEHEPRPPYGRPQGPVRQPRQRRRRSRRQACRVL
jgi:poly(3-hydroxybutyrate) depolymerase